MRRLRTLSEEECHLRCYGAHDVTVRRVRVEVRPGPRGGETRSGEDLRRDFVRRLEAREPEAA